MNPSSDRKHLVEVAAERETASAAADESVDLAVDLGEHQLKWQIEHLAQLKDNHRLRLSYTGRIYWLVLAWLACVIGCVVLTGFKAWGFSLSDAVLIAFITSTTVNVVGLFVLVAKWLFPDGKHSGGNAGSTSPSA